MPLRLGETSEDISVLQAAHCHERGEVLFHYLKMNSAVLECVRNAA
jgi:hypothetical protein